MVAFLTFALHAPQGSTVNKTVNRIVAEKHIKLAYPQQLDFQLNDNMAG